MLIRGAGVDLNRFRPVAKQSVSSHWSCSTHVIRQGDINEYVTAAHELHDEGVVARFLLVGDADPMNPTSIPVKTLEAWHGKKGLEWLGWCKDILNYWKGST